MRDFVRLQTAILLRRLAYQVNRAAKQPDDESIHDLRVAIRRFRRCLQLFADFYPGKSWKKIRNRLSDVMDAAGAVRDFDIAGDVMVKAGVAPRSTAFKRLDRDREDASRHLVGELKRLKGASFSKKWRGELGL